MTERTEAQRLADALRGFRSLDCQQAAAELLRLEADNAALRDAADNALNTLIGCCVSAGGVDDRKTILETQAMLRVALSGTAPARKPLTDHQRGNLLIEHMGPSALAGGRMTLIDAFSLGITAAERKHGITGDAA